MNSARALKPYSSLPEPFVLMAIDVPVRGRVGTLRIRVLSGVGIRVIVDPASMRYVDGSEVVWTESFEGSGFEVTNPNVVASCGCGSSFRVADEEQVSAV